MGRPKKRKGKGFPRGRGAAGIFKIHESGRVKGPFPDVEVAKTAEQTGKESPGGVEKVGQDGRQGLQRSELWGPPWNTHLARLEDSNEATGSDQKRPLVQ